MRNKIITLQDIPQLIEEEIISKEDIPPIENLLNSNCKIDILIINNKLISLMDGKVTIYENYERLVTV